MFILKNLAWHQNALCLSTEKHWEQICTQDAILTLQIYKLAHSYLKGI